MTTTLNFDATAKVGSGKSSAKIARKQGLVPAIIYGGAHKEMMVNLDLNSFFTEYKKGNMQSKLTKIAFDGKTITTVIRAVQLDPVTDVPLHVDLQEVSEGSEIKIAVRLRIIGEEKCSAIKLGGILNILTRTIEVFCSPFAIPQSIEVDVSELILGRTIHINDITLPAGVVPCDRSNFVVLSLSGSSDDSGGESKEAAE
jgi:large subunit ribosomal protein L25